MSKKKKEPFEKLFTWTIAVAIIFEVIKQYPVIIFALLVIGGGWLYWTRQKRHRLPFSRAYAQTARHRRPTIPKSVRHAVLNLDRSTCQPCGARAPHVKLHIDHILPVSRGGTNDIGNLQVLCRDCNLSKGNRRLWYE